MSCKRKMTREINIGGVKIGGNNPIAIQSMCNTDTRDVKSTVELIKKLQKCSRGFVDSGQLE